MADTWDGRTATVLGGAGFVGSHLCEALVARGCRVTIVDNLTTGAQRNVAALLAGGGATLLRHDVATPLPSVPPPDYVFNLACPASPDDYLPRPVETMLAGAGGTLHGLELARRSGARFLLTSTSEVYGDPQVSPQPETYWGHVNPVGPRSSYDESKRFSEALVSGYRRQHGVDGRIARIFNTYGPRMRIDDGRVVPAFFAAALRGEPLPVHGDGRQTRSLCYVDDLVEGLLALMASDHPGPMNLGRPEEVTMLELAHLVQEVVGEHSGVEMVDGRADDPVRRKPDIRLARRELEWEPRTSLRAGLEASLEWFSRAVDVGSIRRAV